MKRLGYEPKPVDLKVSFGKGDTFWTNAFPSELLAKHQNEIWRFKHCMTLMKYTAPFWALIPLKISLRMLFFSNDFINLMIYPSLALFLGTGNATPDLPSIMMERLFNSPTFGMWYAPDDKALVSNLPPMVVFSEETKFYEDWKTDVDKRGVKFRTKMLRYSKMWLTIFEGWHCNQLVRFCQRSAKRCEKDSIGRCARAAPPETGCVRRVWTGAATCRAQHHTLCHMGLIRHVLEQSHRLLLKTSTDTRTCARGARLFSVAVCSGVTPFQIPMRQRRPTQSARHSCVCQSKQSAPDHTQADP